MKRALPALGALTLALLLAGSAQAGVKRLAWVKAQAVWATQAKAHGAKTVSCNTWTPLSVTLTCAFAQGQKEWQAVFKVYSDCRYFASYMAPRPADKLGRMMFVQSQELDVCERAWWKGLLSPWAAETPR